MPDLFFEKKKERSEKTLEVSKSGRFCEAMVRGKKFQDKGSWEAGYL
jgi:hypothetical protein